jgi:RNA polymerase-binding transcription factor DksA
MHYHYFTLEQRDQLYRRIQESAPKEAGGTNSALASLRESDYGICEACQADIPFVRLLKDPFQRLCGRCR